MMVICEIEKCCDCNVAIINTSLIYNNICYVDGNNTSYSTIFNYANPKGRYHLEDLCVDTRIILKEILCGISDGRV
jgi:hypothetical protein